ncbi:SdpA family antimicrobial peptide system protein [Radiobacillus kanasensis]|uniref:SdpA family antimicrobial peptide system protein n=1 Tax=Radiobacillus kanasensis TaxID=2844358 RepID=UPI001E622B60|nr:SdpA family antimicrobial peptide system protein [Radiobacillus kanasensis]UFT99138.1 SdpA family antimicrobial peptide system protein [Radiobacillus kanasensis]
MEKKKLIIFFFAFSVFWGFIFLSSVITGMGATAVSPTKDSQVVYSSILPQGWGFFSKDPRAPIMGLYAADEKSTEILWPTMRAENIFGLYRKGRAQGVEMGALFTKIEKGEWSKCDNSDLDSCKKQANEVEVENIAPSPLLCGTYYFTQEKTIPWSYFKYSESETKVTKIVKGDITCSAK